MRAVLRKILLIVLPCLLAVAAWAGLLHLADDISAARSYRDSDPVIQAAASPAED